MAKNVKASTAPYSMMITFEISPADEAEFNDIYDNDHIPTIMKLPGVLEVIRFRDVEPNERGGGGTHGNHRVRFDDHHRLGHRQARRHARLGGGVSDDARLRDDHIGADGVYVERWGAPARQRRSLISDISIRGS